jgi:hypothetical protein
MFWNRPEICAVFLADPRKMLSTKLELLLDMARVPPTDISKATNILAHKHFTFAMSILKNLPEKSIVALKLMSQLRKHIPNEVLFKESLQMTIELFDPLWESYYQWFINLGAEGGNI